MSKSEDLGQGGAEDLSALVDGELAASDVTRVCARWREDSDVRSTWHAYHLIGDVLRSGDLSSSPGRDREFLVALRQRLSHEPVVLAPGTGIGAGHPLADQGSRMAASSWRSGRSSLRTSLAIAAGFVAVAGVLVVTQMPVTPGFSPSGPAEVIAAAGPERPWVASAVATYGVPAATVVAAVDRRGSEDEADVVLSGQLIRDARLDEYLAAHKKFGGSSAPGGPSGFLRNAIAENR